MYIPILHMSDFYKTDHRRQYPKGTEYVYSNLTPRGSRITGIDSVVAFGMQYFVQEYLVERFDYDFFHAPLKQVIRAYQRRLDTSLGHNAVPLDHITDLHKLGYLPLRIKALPEGSLCPMRVPLVTIVNTDARFYWLTNWLETLMSNVLWHPITSATIAYRYRTLLDVYAKRTSDMPEFVGWQGHDFSMRGHTSIEASCASGAAHLLSFNGTDTIPSLDFLEEFYGANADTELIGGSVPATEHSVMCMGGEVSEFETFNRLITEVYPKGIVSIVSDTWDYWKILSETLPELRQTIMERDGKVVIRPDSGDPVKIICGDKSAPILSPEHRGTIQMLWDVFGGSVNSKGYKQLDPHIGAIYGDSITYDRAEAILEGLEREGYASTNIVFGIGSYTYQYVTRDTFGFAIKATHGTINGTDVSIFKKPKTDDGLKNSAKGLLRVNEDFTLSQEVSEQEENTGMLQTIFENGHALNTQTLAQIRTRLRLMDHGFPCTSRWPSTPLKDR